MFAGETATSGRLRGEGSKGPAEFEDAEGEAQSEWKIDQRRFEI
jgi:hypothetical protein